MRTFMLVYFWGMAALTFIRCMEMACLTWPHERKPKSLGLAAGETILGGLFMIWAGLLLWR